MKRPILWGAAADAAEELAEALTGFSIQKAIDPLTPEGYLIISNMVAERLAKAAKGSEALIIKAIVDELGLDWRKVSADKIDAAISAIKKSIREHYETKVIPKVAAVLKAEGPKVIALTRASVVASNKLTIGVKSTKRDKDAIAAVQSTHTNFIRHASGERAEKLSKDARKIVAKKLKLGLSTADIGKDLHEYFKAEIPRPDSYWRVVADAFVGRARVTAQINSFEDAGITAFEVVAVLDEVTTDICRFMDGRIFEVAQAATLLKALNELEDPEDVRYANPWVRVGKDEDGAKRLWVPHADGTSTTIAKVETSGVGSADNKGTYSGGKSDAELVKLGIPIPPYHGRCRTTIVAVQ